MLTNKAAIITGASRGLGKAIARAFAAAGADMLLCARNGEDLERACAELEGSKKQAGQRILACAGDLAEERDADRVIQAAMQAFGRIDILVNNAAIQGPIGPFEENDWDAWKRTIQTDLLGPAYLIRSVLPIMKKQGGGKIISLSGGGATGPRENYSAYAVAKTGIVRLTETIAKEAGTWHIDVNAIAPGAMSGRMLEETLAAGEDAVGKGEYAKALERKKNGGTPPEKAAELALFLVGSASDGITGRLISAVWDDRETLRERWDEWKNTDIYTLRRIIPEDREK